MRIKFTYMKTGSLFFFVLTCIFAVFDCSAQKKDLSPADYGKWQSLTAADLSPDGSWVAYRIAAEMDNDTLYLVNRVTKKSYKLEFGSTWEFSGDNQWIAYRI